MQLTETAQERFKSKAARLRRIEQRLYNHPQGLRAIDLAEQCGVDRRTIYRDLGALEEMGIPVWEHQGRFGIDRSSYLSTVRLNRNEAVALFFAARLLAHHSDEHNPHIVSALDKLAAGLPDETIADHITRLAEMVRQRPLRESYVQLFETLTFAWAERRLVRLHYRALNRELTERVIAPYLIEVSRSMPAAYVIGFDQLRNDLRTFKLERIEAAELLSETYHIPSDFDPYDYLASAWGVMNEAEVEVHLRFSPTIAPQIRESRWHPNQRLEECADGGCELFMTINGAREIRPWVLSWGAEVTVLAPESLRSEVAEHAERMLTQYRAGSAE